MLEREPLARAPQTGLYLVGDEHRAVAPAQLLGALQVARGRGRHHAALDRLDDEGGHVARAELRLEALQVAERDARAAWQQRAEALLEELVADQRERPERDPVEAVLARDQARPTRRGACELHRRVHRLGARAGEEHRVQTAREALRERLREHACERRVVDLHAVDEVRVERGMQRLANVGVVVAEARKSLAGVEVEVGATCGVVQVGPSRGAVLLVEAEDPQHVDERRIEVARGQVQGLVRACHGVGDDAERVDARRWSRVRVHGAGGPQFVGERAIAASRA